jgi:hypothetical protein
MSVDPIRTSDVGTSAFEPWPMGAQIHRYSLSPAGLATIGPGDRLQHANM